MARRRFSLRIRRGKIVVLTAFLLIFMLALMALSVDLGYVMLARTQLQVSADSAALASCRSLSSATTSDRTPVMDIAKEYAAYHQAAGHSVALRDSDIEFGTWDAGTQTFTPTAGVGTSMRITTRVDDTSGGNEYFFAKALGKQVFSTSASAIATGNPRDIAFVVDLSGSMNDDSEPCWATYEITNELTASGYPTVGTDLMQDMYTDFNFGSFPGTLQWVGAPVGVTADSRAYANLTNSGPLTGASIAAAYKINSGDSESTRKTKGYRWMIDYQIAVIMPNAKPTPNSTTNYNYWEKYLDYIILNQTVNSGSGTPPTNRGAIPPNQDSDRITGLNNPNSTSFPSASTTERDSYRNKLGYRTYVQFMMDHGRNKQPSGSTYVPLSTSSPDCPLHSEATAGGTFSFPPREQPTHSARRALIAAIQEVKVRNASVTDVSQRDWVSLITFDTVSGTVVRRSLTSDYDAAMAACVTLQAVADDVSSTATETGLIFANSHISSPASGGIGRYNTQKVVVLLTDGMPNLKTSSNSTVSSYRSSNSSLDWYGGSSYEYDAALMQAMTMQGSNWKMFAVGVGLGTDYSFMDRMSRTGGTADDSGMGPRTSANPTAYEQELTEIFQNIIDNPEVRLVQ